MISHRRCDKDDIPLQKMLQKPRSKGLDPMISDHLALASTWRIAKLQEFEQRLDSLSPAETAVGAALLQRLQLETFAVQALQRQQSQQADAAPWWADGEYDDDAAERANDTGTELFCNKDYCAAFTHYTDAIRLCPRKATYHCNRAATALKLQRFSIAAADARQAIRRDSQNIKAYLRAGQAQAGWQKPEEAAKWFRRALLLDKTSAAAQRGLDTAIRAHGRAHAAALQEQAGAGRGDRPGLSRRPVEAEQAAQMLHSSEGMLRAQPTSHAVHCSHAEALIACRRYSDALQHISLLQPGVDKLYLQAEGLWRQAHLAAANAALSDKSQQAVSSSKCADLQLWVQSLQHRMHAAEIACEDGHLNQGVSLLSDLLAELQPEVCSGLYAELLVKKAAAQRQQGQLDVALQDLDCAMAWEPESAKCLQLRALVYREIGNYTQSFMDFTRLGKLMPDDAEVFEELQQAARRCLDSPEAGPKSHGHTASSTWYKTLGLHASASNADVRCAYRQLAGKWHPDKWINKSKSEQEQASKQFADISDAYAALNKA
ncbi:TPA: hypothetical protein ACH3X2_005544 [Trebouxia sp. C0005]